MRQLNNYVKRQIIQDNVDCNQTAKEETNVVNQMKCLQVAASTKRPITSSQHCIRAPKPVDFNIKPQYSQVAEQNMEINQNTIDLYYKQFGRMMAPNRSLENVNLTMVQEPAIAYANNRMDTSNSYTFNDEQIREIWENKSPNLSQSTSGSTSASCSNWNSRNNSQEEIEDQSTNNHQFNFGFNFK